MAVIQARKKGAFGPLNGKSSDETGKDYVAQKKVGFPDGIGKADKDAGTTVLLDNGPKPPGCRGPQDHIRVVSLGNVMRRFGNMPRKQPYYNAVFQSLRVC